MCLSSRTFSPTASSCEGTSAVAAAVSPWRDGGPSSVDSTLGLRRSALVLSSPFGKELRSRFLVPAGALALAFARLLVSCLWGGGGGFGQCVAGRLFSPPTMPGPSSVARIPGPTCGACAGAPSETSAYRKLKVNVLNVTDGGPSSRRVALSADLQ